jgi:hypothetical protein
MVLKLECKRSFSCYCLETIIIGLFTLLKLAIATIVRKKDWWQNGESRTMVHGSFFMLFFLIHYGLFTGIQTALFLGVSSLSNSNSPGLSQFLLHPFHYLGKNGLLMLAVFIFSYGYENLSRFIFSNDYRTKSFSRIMFEPYARIFVQ